MYDIIKKFQKISNCIQFNENKENIKRFYLKKKTIQKFDLTSLYKKLNLFFFYFNYQNSVKEILRN